jgi:hypothetical protein
VVVVAFWFRAFVVVGAFFGAEAERVVVFFLPAVAERAGELPDTAVHDIIDDQVLSLLPIRTEFGLVGIALRGPAIILPIVGIHASSHIMLGQVKRAEHSLVEEQVEVSVEYVVVDQCDPDVLLAVGEGTEIPVLAG